MRFSDILDFIKRRRDERIYDFKTYHSLMTACRAVLILIEQGEDSAEYVLEHLAQILARYPGRRPKVTERTLKSYQTRAKRALIDYLGRPPSGRGPRVPILGASDEPVGTQEAGRAPSYAANEWSGTRGIWWETMTRSSPTPVKLPKWLADNRTALRWEVAAAAKQDPQQRFATLRRACATGMKLLKLNRDPEQVLKWVDPLPESSRAALARLRAEYRRRS
jgi:hypothetical protein